MSDEIRVGDLVMVVKPAPCCGWNEKLGFVFRVAWAGMAEPGRNICCGKYSPAELAADWESDRNLCISQSLLRKIPHLTEPQETETEVTA